MGAEEHGGFVTEIVQSPQFQFCVDSVENTCKAGQIQTQILEFTECLL